MSKNFIRGERIIIKLNSGENYEGDYLRGSGNRIEADNIHHLETGAKINSTWSFHKNEIESVYKLKNKVNDDDLNKSVEEKKSNNYVLMNRDEYERLKELANNYIYVKSEDKTYFDAVNNISNFESIGILSIGHENGRHGKVELLAISTWKQIYIFDFKCFRTNRIPKEIEHILESFYIKKIVHNGGQLRECLKHSHNILINNIHDTLVSYLLIEKNSTGTCPKTTKNIGEILTHYFNFPSTLLNWTSECLKGSWDNRPLTEERLASLARLVSYLISLKDHQLSLLLKDFDKAIFDFYKINLKNSSVHLTDSSTNQIISKEIDEIIPSELLLNKSIENVKYEN